MKKSDKEFILEWMQDYIDSIDSLEVATKYASKEMYRELVECLNEIECEEN